MQDLKFAIRQLLKNPGFTAVAVLTLALGIGVNVAVFSMVNAILLRPFPADDPERLVTVSVYDSHYGATKGGSTSLPDLLVFQERASSFENMFGMYADGFVLAGTDGAERIQGSVVSPAFLDVLGIRPAVGRGFVKEDGEPAGARAILISYGLWQRRFNGQRDLEALDARINSATVRIIGVMPPGSRFPIESDLWMPLRPDPNASRGNRYIKIFGRLKPEATREGASAEVRALAEQLAQQYPQTNRTLTASVYELRDLLLSGPIQLLLWLLLGAVGCVLLITCANVSGLIFVRAWSRRKELAIRASLGAAQRRVLGLLVIESLALAALGGLGGSYSLVSPCMPSSRSSRNKSLTGSRSPWTGESPCSALPYPSSRA